MPKKEEYQAVPEANGASHHHHVVPHDAATEGMLQAVRWPREPGLFSSTSSPDPYPQSAEQWWSFFTLARNRPFTHEWMGNLKAGATVACVNVPLSISLALASGGTPTQGMICALWSSICIGVLGGSQFNVVGTTSALSGMLDKLAIRYGHQVLPTVAVYTSLFLLLFWIVRIDKLLKYVATPVAHGFATGVGVMIGLGPLSPAFGLRGLPPADGFVAKLVQFLANIGSSSATDAALYFASCGALFYLAFKWTKVPWVLALAAAGIALGMVTSAAAAAHPSLFLLREKFPVIEMSLVAPGTVLPSWIPVVGTHDVAPHPACTSTHGSCPPVQDASPAAAWEYQSDVIFYSFGCAVVSLLETLISAMMANRMLKGSAPDSDILTRAYSSSRESLGLAITAFVCGVTGSIAPAAALARTSLNVKSGAFSRISTLVNAVLLAIIAFIFMPKFEFLPFACVGAILLLVAYRLIDFNELALIAKGDPAGMYLCILTCICCMFMDTFAGLLIGAAASIAMNWSILGTLPVDVTRSKGGALTTVAINGPITFANVPTVDPALESVLVSILDAEDARESASVHLDLTECTALDFDSVEMLDEWARKIGLSGARLTVEKGVNVTRALTITHHLQPSAHDAISA